MTIFNRYTKENCITGVAHLAQSLSENEYGPKAPSLVAKLLLIINTICYPVWLNYYLIVDSKEALGCSRLRKLVQVNPGTPVIVLTAILLPNQYSIFPDILNINQYSIFPDILNINQYSIFPDILNINQHSIFPDILNITASPNNGTTGALDHLIQHPHTHKEETFSVFVNTTAFSSIDQYTNKARDMTCVQSCSHVSDQDVKLTRNFFILVYFSFFLLTWLFVCFCICIVTHPE